MANKPPVVSDTYSNIFKLESLIALPLKAVIDANAFAAKRAIDIIREYGFEEQFGENDYGKLRMIRFTYDYIDSNGHLQDMNISIPFITLIPLPLLEVRKADFDFSIRILDKRNGSNSINAILSSLDSERHRERSSSLAANMNINVKMQQSDLPNGILQLMNIGQEATGGKTAKLISVFPERLHFGNKTSKQQLELTIKVGDKSQLDKPFTIRIQSKTEVVTSVFDKEINLLKGDIVGKATKEKLIILPEVVESEGVITGVIKIELSADKKLVSENNGFVIIHSKHFGVKKIYYKIKNN